TFFPIEHDYNGGCKNECCDALSYSTAVVPLTPLPETTLFSGAIDAETPPTELGTPTLAGLTGTISQAEVLAAENPDAFVAIVLVTDGEPSDCQDKIADSAAVVGAIKDRIPTFVIGVGSALTSLNAIAVAGGTGSAFILSTGDPVVTTQAFKDAINT